MPSCTAAGRAPTDLLHHSRAQALTRACWESHSCDDHARARGPINAVRMRLRRQVIDRSVTARNSALTKISNTIDAWQYQVGRSVGPRLARDYAFVVGILRACV